MNLYCNATDVLLFTMLENDAITYRNIPEKHLNICLIYRNEDKLTESNKWALPGGFLNPDDDINLQAAALRELGNDIGFDSVFLKELRTWSNPNRDPRGRVISTSFLGVVEQGFDLKAHLRIDKEYDEVMWFNISVERVSQPAILEDSDAKLIFSEDYELRLTNGDTTLTEHVRKTTTKSKSIARIKYEQLKNGAIAFDHAQMILDAYLYLQENIEGTEIAFNFLPEYFTLTDLKQVYETVLKKELTAANFRRKITQKYDMVLETEFITHPPKTQKNDILKMEGALSAFEKMLDKGLEKEYYEQAFELIKAHFNNGDHSEAATLLEDSAHILTQCNQAGLSKQLHTDYKKLKMIDSIKTQNFGHRASKYYTFNMKWNLPLEGSMK